MKEIVNYLADILLKNNLAVVDTNPNTKQFFYRTYDNVAPFTGKFMDFDSIKFNKYSDNFISTPSNYNFTIDKKQIKNCPYQEHHVTIVTVNPKTVGYKFKVEGYMLDPINYMRLNNVNGFAINGGYFNIGKDYLPIGPYKDKKGMKVTYPIPEKYRNVFGYVCFQNNEMIITRNLKLAEKYEYFLSTGPFLIEKGNIVFKENEERFACVEIGGLKPPMKLIEERSDSVTVSGYIDYSLLDGKCGRKYIEELLNFPRCDKIKPGELSHSDNPNPRSAVCLLKNGTIIFMTVEGRGERGVGMDLKLLALSIKKTFPDVVNAINLDGGRSSNLAWKAPGTNTVYVSNPSHLYQYPVGNIITFQKV